MGVIDSHIPRAIEVFKNRCPNSTDIVPIVTATRRGCEAAALYTSRCHLISTVEERAERMEKACIDVEDAIRAACDAVSEDVRVYVGGQVGHSICTCANEAKSSLGDTDSWVWQLQHISQTRIHATVYTVLGKLFEECLGYAPGTDAV
jgi:hypothetical protein